MKSLPLLLTLFAAFAGLAQGATRVACVGDSITFGWGVESRESNSYPAVLQRLLGEEFGVKNFGVSGTTALKKGDHPYRNEKAFQNATNFKPHIVIIKLGTNDSKPQNRTNITEFAADFAALVDEFAALETRPKIFVCLPVPVYQTAWGINEASVAGEIIPAIKKVAAQKKLPIIDLHTALSGKPSLFPDNVHPNGAGAKLMAETIYAAIRER